MYSKREKILIGVCIALGLILVFGFVYFESELKYYKDLANGVSEKVEIDLISQAKVKDLKNNKESTFGEVLATDAYVVIYLARPTCSHCVAQTPIMEKVASSKKVSIYYLNTDELTEDQFMQLFSIDTDLFGKKGSNFGTPTTVIMKDYKILDSIVGEAAQSEVESFLKTFKLI